MSDMEHSGPIDASPQWLSIVEYARRYQVSDMTVRRRIKTGRLQAVLQDGKYYIPAEEAATGSAPSKPLMASRPPDAYEFNASVQDQKAAPNPIPGPSPTGPSISSNPSVLRPPESKVFTPMASSPQAPVSSELSSPSEAHAGTKASNQSLAIIQKALNQLDAHLNVANENYAHKEALLKAEIQQKDSEIVRLKQTIEDLQTLISVIEKPESPNPA